MPSFDTGEAPRRSTSSLDALRCGILRADGGSSAVAALLQGSSGNTQRAPAHRLYELVAPPPRHFCLGVNDTHGDSRYPGLLDERLCNAGSGNLYNSHLNFWAVPQRYTLWHCSSYSGPYDCWYPKVDLASGARTKFSGEATS